MVGPVDGRSGAPGDTARPLVVVVDDDESVRESLPDLVEQLGYSAKAFSSAEEFLGSGALSATRCLLLDVAMPGMTGPQLQQELRERGVATPVVFITAQADASIRGVLMKRGAVECLFKPFTDVELRAALRIAIQETAH